MNPKKFARIVRSLAALSFALVSASAFADGANEAIPSFYQEAGHSPNRDYVNQHANEKVDPFTGKLQWHFTDMFIPGNGGMDLKVQRSYSSLNELLNDPSPIGAGWTMHFGRVLRKASVTMCDFNNTSALNNAVMELSDGSRHILYPNDAGPLAQANTVISTGLWLGRCGTGPEGGLVVTSPDGTKYEFTVAGPLIGNSPTRQATWYVKRITDRNLNYIEVNYDYIGANFGITSISTSDGRNLTYGYSGGRLETISDGSRTWTYVSEAIPGQADHYFLTEVRRPDGVGWLYEYNPSASGPGLGSPGGFSMKKVTYPTGGVIQYTYGFLTINALALPVSTVVTKKKAGNAEWTYTYTPATAQIPLGVFDFTINPDDANPKFDKTLVEGPEGSHLYLHIGYGSATSGSVFLIGSLAGKVSKTLVGGSPQVTEIEAYGWEASHQVSSQANRRPGSNIIFDSNTKAPRMIKKTISRAGLFSTTYGEFDEYNNAKKIEEKGTHTRNIEVTYYIDLVNWILHTRKKETSIITGAGFSSEQTFVDREFDDKGNVIQENRNGVVTKYTYDAGNIALKKDPRDKPTTYTNYVRGIPTGESQPESVNISRNVSPEGNVMSEVDGENVTTRYDYDALNRLKRIEHGSGNPITIEWSPNSRKLTRGGYTETVTFDEFGREKQVQHTGDGGTPILVTYELDSLGRRTFASYPNSSVGTGYGFNIVGEPLFIKHEYNPASQAFASARSFVYDLNTTKIFNERGKQYTHTYAQFGDPAGSHLMSITAPIASASVAMERNGMGQLLKVTQGLIERTYGYDTRYYLTKMNDPEVGDTIYTRDASGNMETRKVGASPLTNFGYDDRNRLISTTYTIGTPNVSRTYYKDDKPKTVSTDLTLREYTYDGGKNLVQERLTISAQAPYIVTYGHDGNGALSGMSYSTGQTVSYLPDAYGRPTRAFPYVNEITHHPGGQLNKLTYANGVTTTIGLDSRQWPKTLAIAGPQPLFDSTYSYDGLGNVLGISDTVDSSFNRGLDYDDIDRVTGASGSWGNNGSISYEDGKGNISSQTLGSLGTLTYTYNTALNRLTTIGGRKSYAFTYDSQGNVTGNGSNTFAYNDASNMRCANCGQPTEILYDYDGTGMRVRAQKGTASTYYMYGQGGQLLWEVAPTGLKEYVYVGGKQVAMREKPLAAGSGSHVVSVARDGVGAASGTVTGSGINCGKTCMNDYVNGASLTLNASATGGASFVQWSGVACSGGNNSATCSFNVAAPLTVTAVFTKPPSHAISVARIGNASSAGSVSSSPAGISCGTDCAQDYPVGTALTLTASISDGTFAEWQGVTCTGSNTTPTCAFAVSGAVTAKAKFTRPANYTVTVSKLGNAAATGTVTSSPAGISCGSDCTEAFAESASITLTAAAGAGAAVEWSGVTCAEGNQSATCTFASFASRTVTATFNGAAAVSHVRNDLNGDGRSDVIWYHSGVFGLIGMQANGLALDPWYAIDVRPSAAWQVVGTGDLNGDGRADVVWRNTATGEVHGQLMNGSTVLAQGTIWIESDLQWKIEQIADVDGDGRAELIWKHQGTGFVHVMMMNGLAVTGGQVVYAEPDLGWKIVASGDMNGDGRADLLWRHQTTGNVFVMLMNGFTVTGGGVIYSEPNLDWKIVGLADFNNDGRADLLWHNTATGEVYEMQMNGTVVSAGQVIYSEPNPQWKIVALGDYNGDGRHDVLWQNSATGQVYMLLMNGFTVSSSGVVYTEPDTQWKIVGP